MSCPRLTELQSLSTGELMDLAISVFEENPGELTARIDAACDGDESRPSLQAHLADLVYYQEGHLNALRQEFNCLSRLQLIRELQVYGRWDEEVDHPVDTFRLRVRVLGAVREAQVTQPGEEDPEAATAPPPPIEEPATEDSSAPGSPFTLPATTTEDTTMTTSPRPGAAPAAVSAIVDGNGSSSPEHGSSDGSSSGSSSGGSDSDASNESEDGSYILVRRKTFRS